MNILIIKTAALGDVLRCTFITQALKDKYSKFKNNGKITIYWITSKSATPLFVNNPYVDTVLVEEETDKVKNIEFDLVINLEEGEDLCKFVSSLKYKDLIGFYFKDGKIIPTETAEEWYNMSAIGPKPQNDILKKKNKKTHRQIMGEIVGVDYNKYTPFIRLTKKQRIIASDFLRRYNLSKNEMIIGINTGAADRWPKSLSVDKTVKIIDELYKKYKSQILLFGGPSEIERNKQIIAQSNAHIIDTGCGNNLYEFPALISLCSLFITSDSLGMHIALALKRKTVCFIGPTSPAEIDMYGLGEKVVPKSKCICCYTKHCKSMDKIDLKEVFNSIEKLISFKVTILITAFKEPLVRKAIEAALNQKTRYKYDILVSAPDDETIKIAKEYAKKYKNVKLFKDPGKGKSFALNLVFKNVKTDILILTDGDVWISENSVEDIVNLFLDPEIGCVSGRPVPVEDKKTKFGYWANFLFDAAHRTREIPFESNSFLECSGYLFAFRKEYINKIPIDVAEDTIIPYIFWEKGYKIGYSPNAKVVVKNVDNWNDWIKQKLRTSKAHETLYKYVDIKITKRVKSFSTEYKGLFWVLCYARNLRQLWWSLLLIFARLYMWIKVFLDTKIRDIHYGDAWERIESTK